MAVTVRERAELLKLKEIREEIKVVFAMYKNMKVTFWL